MKTLIEIGVVLAVIAGIVFGVIFYGNSRYDAGIAFEKQAWAAADSAEIAKANKSVSDKLVALANESTAITNEARAQHDQDATNAKKDHDSLISGIVRLRVQLAAATANGKANGATAPAVGDADSTGTLPPATASGLDGFCVADFNALRGQLLECVARYDSVMATVNAP